MKHKIWQALQEPSEEFTPIPFWFFNDRPDKEKIRNQLRDFVEKGVNGIVIHPRIGIPDELIYLSEEYFDWMRYIVDTAASLHMKIVLYDEGMYPSGSAHGMVVKNNPEYASVGLTLVEGNEKLQAMHGKLIVDVGDEKYLVQHTTGGTIRGIHFGEDDGEAGAPASANILNPKAVEKFIRLTHEQYYAHLKEFFGTTIIGFFTDEPCILGRNSGAYRDWTQGLEKDIVAAGGRLRDLVELFRPQKREADNTTISIYRQLVKQRLNKVYYKSLSDWCQEHGIALMGHPGKSDDMEEETYFHIPGQDLVFRWVAPEKNSLQDMDSVQAKCSADMARLLGRRRNSNECFGVCTRDGIPWYMTAGDMKWFIDWLGIRGVNLFIPHAFFYSVEGERKGERPPDVGPNNIWWPYYKQFSDYMKRLSYLMTDAKSCAKVAVLCESGRMPYKEIAILYEKQIEFHYVPLSLISKAYEKNGRLCMGEYSFDWVLDLIHTPLPKELLNIHRFTDVEEFLGSYEEQGTLKIVSNAPSLRMAHHWKDGEEYYLLFNEGETAIDLTLQFLTNVSPVLVDLWKMDYNTVEKNSLSMEPHEMKLFLFTESDDIDHMSTNSSSKATGNAANLYTEHSIPYGIMCEEKL